MRILLVDEDDVLRKTRRMVLADWNVEVETPSAAAQVLQTQLFSIVIIGQTVPVASAAELAATAKRIGLDVLVPHHAADGLSLTAAEVYTPPIFPQELRNRISVLCARRGGR